MVSIPTTFSCLEFLSDGCVEFKFFRGGVYNGLGMRPSGGMMEETFKISVSSGTVILNTFRGEHYGPLV